jgi:hypothetical protein
MSLVEYLRVRKAAIIVAIVLTVLVLANTLSVLWGIHNGGLDPDDSHAHVVTHAPSATVHISIGGVAGTRSDAPTPPAAPGAHVKHITSLRDLNFAVPLGVLFGIAGFVAIAFATILGTSLNKENTLGGFAFTKPIARERLALTYFAVDAGGIVAMFLYVLLFEFIEVAILGLADRIAVDANAFGIAAISLGAAAMWYGLLQAVTSAMRFSGGMFIGIGWGVFCTLLPLSAFMALGPVFHTLIMALNYLNPLAYYSGLDMTGGAATTSSVLALGEGARIAITWSIGIVACAVAALSWKRVEV